MRKLNLIAILILTLFSPLFLSGQKVGVVLSGGGGSAMAHIGVLKALEENNIPIDYITGSSMGALIGALYASGYSPLEIEAMVLSDKFTELTEGDLDDQFSYYERQQKYDPSYIRFRIKPDKPLVNSIPTHLYNSQQLDFYLMTLFAGAEAASNYNFDSLMIPFRCVASDIYKKESVVFKNGNISESVRASMTYPFYLQAIEIDSTLLFDGGLYNNFPKKLMKDTFKPDFIIGSNVSSNAQKPEEDNLFSQLENMLSEPTDYTIEDEEGILINIKLDIGTLDLSRIKESIDKGYEETSLFMDSLKTRLNSRMSELEVDKRRLKFKKEKVALHFESITISGLDKTQSNFIKASFGQVKDFNELENVQRLYYKLYADDKIKFIFPKAKYNRLTGKYNLNLEILKEKNLEIQIGGVLSTSPINTGYASFKYNIFNKTSLSIGLNGYFGNVYQSAKLNMVLEVPAKIPFYWEPYFCINDYDYFKNNVSVFDEVQPPYMVTNEIYIGNSIGFPFILNSNFSLDYKYFEQGYSYYINPDFSLKDDADNTQFNANTIGITIDKFNYNFRQYAFSGTKFYFNTRLVTGWENTNYAFPTANRVNNQSRRTWLEMHLEYSGYPIDSKFYSLGLLFEGYFSNMPDFTNYFGTIMEARQFQPLTESITLFQPNLRSTSWMAIGMKNVLKPMHNFQVRLEAYIFQPSWAFYAGPDGETDKGLLFDNRYLIMSAAIVYHTNLGPISLNANYYQYLDPETSILLNFGFTIFNKNAKD